ncbi:MAG: OmpA family protein [Muribaculaceae bacterium]|nr:OmpA family protein [Muribaculaceae bacterium]
MKKMLLTAALIAGGLMSANAQQAMVQPGFFDNWSIGLDGGVTTPLNHAAFWGDMRGVVGLNLKKQITPVFGLGVEGAWAVNTSSWRGQIHSTTAFDSQYVGAFGSVNLVNLFTPWGEEKNHVFDVEAVLGAGWGHKFENKNVVPDWNYFATKVGLNLNFHASDRVTIALKPSITWNMSDAGVNQSSAAYNVNKATFNLMAGVSVALGNGFTYVNPYDQSAIDALNERVNGLRNDLGVAAAALAQSEANNAQLAAQLAECRNKAPEVIKTNTDQLSTVRYVNFEIGKTNITASQMPNVAAVASYLKNHPKSKVVIKGYASQDGPVDVNIRLANERAASVRNTLINKYGIAADRIQAEGQGIGHMFEEESWNRVAICTLDEPAKTTTVIKK